MYAASTLLTAIRALFAQFRNTEGDLMHAVGTGCAHEAVVRSAHTRVSPPSSVNNDHWQRPVSAGSVIATIVLTNSSCCSTFLLNQCCYHYTKAVVYNTSPLLFFFLVWDELHAVLFFQFVMGSFYEQWLLDPQLIFPSKYFCWVKKSFTPKKQSPIRHLWQRNGKVAVDYIQITFLAFCRLLLPTVFAIYTEPL